MKPIKLFFLIVPTYVGFFVCGMIGRLIYAIHLYSECNYWHFSSDNIKSFIQIKGKGGLLNIPY